MVDYVAIGVNNQRRERGQILFLTSVVLTLITLVASSAIVLLVVMNLHYYEMFRELLKILYKNMLTDELSLNKETTDFRLVCYYTHPTHGNQRFNDLHIKHVNESLCTHINIGMVNIINSSINMGDELNYLLKEEVPVLKQKNPELKVLLWVGGGDPADKKSFAEMSRKHETRKKFIKSLKEILRTYELDGVDLDWEFPSAYDKDRQHLSQLLYEIKEEYKRERKEYLLSVAVGAVRGIALYAYDVRELNLYADYVNLMTYDYHFFSKSTPFTGLNAPLYARENEKSILETLNINYSINWWLDFGIEPKKLVVGLPTYGHSFRLVNPLNTRIGAPAEGFGEVGQAGFASYTEICYFINSNLANRINFDDESCSPYLSNGMEWISYENEQSIACKTKLIKSLDVGGVMIFDLNSDDTKGFCNMGYKTKNLNETNLQDDLPPLPLTNTVKKVAFY